MDNLEGYVVFGTSDGLGREKFKGLRRGMLTVYQRLSYISARAVFMSEEKRPKPSLPHVTWLDRPHPCPDIEARIREVRSSHHE